MKFLEFLKKVGKACKWLIGYWLDELERYGSTDTSYGLSNMSNGFGEPCNLFPDNGRYPNYTIGEGGLPGMPKYCIHDGRIYEGPVISSNCIACISDDGHIYEGYFPAGNCIANIGSDGRIYEGYFRGGKCLGCIIDGKIYLGGYFPTSSPDFNIY